MSLLLRLSGEPGLRVLGMPDRSWPALDLRRALAVVVVVMALPQAVGGWLQHLLHLPGIGVTETDLPRVYVWSELVGAVNAGVVEEVAVLGFLVHRTRQRGWSLPLILAAGVTVRVSFHLYYGWGALPMALWAAVALLAFLAWRPRRVAPFVLAHATLDALLTLRNFDLRVVFVIFSYVAALAGLVGWLVTTERFLLWRSARILTLADTTSALSLSAIRAAAAGFTPPPAQREQLMATALAAIPSDPGQPGSDSMQLLVIRGRRKSSKPPTPPGEVRRQLRSVQHALRRLPHAVPAAARRLPRLLRRLRPHVPPRWPANRQSDWLTLGAAVGAALHAEGLPAAALLPRRVTPAQLRRLRPAAELLWTDARDRNERAQLWDRFDAGPPPE